MKINRCDVITTMNSRNNNDRTLPELGTSDNNSDDEYQRLFIIMRNNTSNNHIQEFR